MIFDTHAHYDDNAFDADRAALIESLPKNNIKAVCNVGANMATSNSTCELAEKYEHIYAAIGVHPDDAIEIMDENNLSLLSKMAQENKKVVAIGEIGLDYHWNVHDPSIQKTAFEKQIMLANSLRLPIIIHSRDACNDTMTVLKHGPFPEKRGVMHCFSYSKETAVEILDMGFFIGIGGVSTFSNAKKLKEVIKTTPLDRIVLETDCPYLAPVPHRGERNCSLYLPLVIEAIAALKEVSPQYIEEATYENALRLYNI